MTRIVPLIPGAPRWRTVSLDMDRAVAESLMARGEFHLALDYLGKSLTKRIDRAFDTLHANQSVARYAERIADPAARAQYLARCRIEIDYAARRQLRGEP